MHIRAKFRVLETSRNHEDVFTVRMRPVKKKSQYDPEGSEENALFWKFTPSGEITLGFHAPEENPEDLYKIGQAFYVDVVPYTGSGPKWIFRECRAGESSFGLNLSMNGGYGNIEMGIDNPPVVKTLLDTLVENHKAYAETGALRTWSVLFGRTTG